MLTEKTMTRIVELVETEVADEEQRKAVELRIIQALIEGRVVAYSEPTPSFERKPPKPEPAPRPDLVHKFRRIEDWAERAN